MRTLTQKPRQYGKLMRLFMVLKFREEIERTDCRFTTLGCKVNQYETQRILDDFEARGFTILKFKCIFGAYVINACSVRMAAEHKSRQMVRKVRSRDRCRGGDDRLWRDGAN